MLTLVLVLVSTVSAVGAGEFVRVTCSRMLRTPLPRTIAVSQVSRGTVGSPAAAGQSR